MIRSASFFETKRTEATPSSPRSRLEIAAICLVVAARAQVDAVQK